MDLEWTSKGCRHFGLAKSGHAYLMITKEDNSRAFSISAALLSMQRPVYPMMLCDRAQTTCDMAALQVACCVDGKMTA